MVKTSATERSIMPVLRSRTVLLLLTLLALTASTAAVRAPRSADLDGRAILSPGTHGYHCYRIPALVTTNDGTLLLFAEGRKPDCSDTGRHDVVVVRSTDGGATWSDPRVVHAGGDSTAHNPTPVVDSGTGRVVLLTSRNYRTAWVQHSDDDGLTWSAPVEITRSVSESGWTSYATGPSHAIQLVRGEHAGRLVAGTTYRTADGTKGVALVHSDDGGLTWDLGAYDHSAAPELNVQEPSVFERPDGSLFVLARNEKGTASATVASAVAVDGGERFAEGFHAGPAEQGLAVPTVQASTLELRATDRGDRYNRVLLAAPSRQGETRERMTIRSTYKGGAEWVDPGGGTVVYEGMSSYSDLTSLADGRVGLAYERAVNWSHGYVWFTTFTESDLGLPDGDTAGLPLTPDSSPNGLHSWLHGGAAVVPGRFGEAVALDGVDDHVQLPFAERLAVSSGDFTWSVWFSYGGGSAPQPLLWAYNQGSVYSQLWLRAEPDRDRLRAWAQSGENSVVLETGDAYDDERWHHVVLRRAGERFTLHVDGLLVASERAPGLGSLSPKRPFTIHLGQRLDGAQHLAGKLDEVRLYGRALHDSEITALYRSNAAIDDGLRIRLAFQAEPPKKTTNGG